LYFYDFGGGTAGVRESLSMDNGEKAVLDGIAAQASLTDIYLTLNPDAADVPQAILDADARTVRARAESVAEPDAVSERSESTTELNQAILSASASNCSADYFGDGWGGDWFLNNFCNQGNYRWCLKNLDWADSGEGRHPWYSWRQFEGDFNEHGHISGTRISCHWYGCDFRTTILDYDVLPRHYEIWTFTNGSDWISMHGRSTCGHMSFASLWN
jgi:hypothetical protein